MPLAILDVVEPALLERPCFFSSLRCDVARLGPTKRSIRPYDLSSADAPYAFCADDASISRQGHLECDTKCNHVASLVNTDAPQESGCCHGDSLPAMAFSMDASASDDMMAVPASLGCKPSFERSFLR
jgi:hypothetical protein